MNTKEHFVVTIGREVGSGGHTVGCLLAKKLDVRVYDKVLVESLERQFNLSVSEIEQLKSKKKNWLADFISKVSPMPTAEALIDGIDKARANYIQRYTGVSRYDLRNYDLVLKSDGHSEEELADYIYSYIQSYR